MSSYHIPKNHGLSADFLRTLYTLEEPVGILRHKQRSVSMFKDGKKFSAQGMCDHWNGRYAGKIVNPNAIAYPRTGIQMPDGRWIRVFVHNIIWCMRYGEWPTKTVDHVNRNPLDNRKENHRLASSDQQGQNRSMMKSNTSGVTGVVFHSRDKKWQATIMVKGKAIRLYYGDNFEDAIAARKQAEREYFGEYARM